VVDWPPRTIGREERRTDAIASGRQIDRLAFFELSAGVDCWRRRQERARPRAWLLTPRPLYSNRSSTSSMREASTSPHLRSASKRGSIPALLATPFLRQRAHEKIDRHSRTTFREACLAGWSDSSCIRKWAAAVSESEGRRRATSRRPSRWDSCPRARNGAGHRRGDQSFQRELVTGLPCNLEMRRRLVHRRVSTSSRSRRPACRSLSTILTNLRLGPLKAAATC